MDSLVDTNILVYCFDSSEREKRTASRELLRKGSSSSSIVIPHQALIEFVSVVTRHKGDRSPLLPNDEAYRQVEGFMTEFSVLYPNEYVVQTAMRGMAAYGLSWFDAHLWAYADHYGIREILSEDFEHGRFYGSVRVRNPFVALGLG